MSDVDKMRRRRTFAIISHPDAGKTTVTEKLLLFGKAIQMAGTVKSRKAARHATSDWMELEKQRGKIRDSPGPASILIWRFLSGKNLSTIEGHSIKHRQPESKYSSNPSAVASSRSLILKKSKWYMISPLAVSYSFTIEKVGLVTLSITPFNRHTLFTRVVFPDPNSPFNIQTGRPWEKSKISSTTLSKSATDLQKTFFVELTSGNIL